MQWERAREQIIKTRTLKGLTLVELAKRVGTTPGYLHDIEHGRTAPSMAMLERLASALGLLFTLEEEDNGDQS